MPTVWFAGPRRIPYPGGCVLEPAPYALDYLLRWPAEVTVNGQVLECQPVFPLICKMLARPEDFGLTRADAQAARDLYLALAGQALEQEGGQREWLKKEFLSC